MTNHQRIELAAKKMLDLVAGALEGLVSFQVIELPDKRTVYAICFDTEVWTFDRRLKLKQTNPVQK